MTVSVTSRKEGDRVIAVSVYSEMILGPGLT